MERDSSTSSTKLQMPNMLEEFGTNYLDGSWMDYQCGQLRFSLVTWRGTRQFHASSILQMPDNMLEGFGTHYLHVRSMWTVEILFGRMERKSSISCIFNTADDARYVGIIWY
jgi:hypothetical protein